MLHERTELPEFDEQQTLAVAGDKLTGRPPANIHAEISATAEQPWLNPDSDPDWWFPADQFSLD